MRKGSARRVAATSPNPLARWFAANPTITQQEFADRCSVIDGRRVSQAQVSHWVGDRVPILATRRLIDRAASGQVPSDSWPTRPTAPAKQERSRSSPSLTKVPATSLQRAHAKTAPSRGVS
jgi:hypothetical protein